MVNKLLDCIANECKNEMVWCCGGALCWVGKPIIVVCCMSSCDTNGDLCVAVSNCSVVRAMADLAWVPELAKCTPLWRL